MASSVASFALNKQLKYKLFPSKSKVRDFWKNLEVNIDSFCDKWEAHQPTLESLLNEFNSEDLKEICSYYGLNVGAERNYQAALLKDQKTKIDIYCCLRFALVNLKTLSRHFKIPIREGNINRPRIFRETLLARKKERLPELFLLIYAQKKGSAKIPFDINSGTKVINFEDATGYIQKLVRYLNTSDTDKLEHILRFAVNINGDFHFLILKETVDKIYPALPDNARVQVGKYILIKLIKATGKLMIDTQNPKEAFKIKNFIARKSKATISYVKSSAIYNPLKFFQAIASEQSINGEIKLIDAGFRKTAIGDINLQIREEKRKNDIIHVINWLKEKGILKLNDFSEFENLVFSSKGITYTIIIHENNWGQLKLKIIDKNKPAQELAEFKKLFERAYGIPFGSILKHEDQVLDRVTITRKMLDNKTIHADMPEEVEELLLELIAKKFIQKPEANAKRRCVNCHHIFWTKGDCTICGNKSFIEGDFLDIHINEGFFYIHFLKSAAKIKGIQATKVLRQIQGRKYPFLEMVNQNGDFLSVYISKSNVPQKILEHFEENGNSLLIILLRFKGAVSQEILEKNFECADFAELVNNDLKFTEKVINEAFAAQKSKWRAKVTTKGWTSYNRLINKGNSYNDQDFEKDIYNILHEIFLIADRMGGRFAGIKAPDGVLSIQNYSQPRKRYCLAWDCKYSSSKRGYQLNDDPKKHKHYLLKLSASDKVRFFGNLNTYAIISQNMNLARYEKFYNKIKLRSRWKGQIILIGEENLIHIYKVYKDNEELIQSYQPIFYKKVFGLFKTATVSESKPFGFISNERIFKTFEGLKLEFNKVHKRFKFHRDNFS